jgi:hypothetical protein
MSDVNLTLDDLQLSVRSSNCLKTLKISSIEELVLLTEQELLQVKSLGKISLDEIKEALEKHGLSLGFKAVPEVPVMNTDLSTSCTQSFPQIYDTIYLDYNVKDINFSVRAQKFFDVMDISKISQVVCLKQADIIAARNAGRKTVQDIERKLQQMGLHLGMSADYVSELISNRKDTEKFEVPSVQLIESNLNRFLAFSKKFKSCPVKDFKSDEIESYFSINNLDLVIIELINKCFEELNEREQFIARSRVFNQNGKYTLEEMGLQFNVTRERIRQIEIGLFKKMKRTFSFALSFIRQALEMLADKGNDPFAQMLYSFKLFATKRDFMIFLGKIGVSSSLLDCFSLPTNLPSTHQINKDILLNYKMPIHKRVLEGILQRDYGLNDIQAQEFLSNEFNTAAKVDDYHFIIDAPTKYLAVANASLGHQNGLPWHDLARISKAMFEKCKGIRLAHSPDVSITENPFLYNYARGIYRNIKYYDISPEMEANTEEKVFQYVMNMSSEVMSLQAIKDDLNLDINIYDLLHLLKVRSDRFNIDTKSGKMAVMKTERGKATGYSVKTIVKDYFKAKDSPLTTFEIKDCLNSNSERHASLVVSQLIEEGSLIRFDGARYALVEILDQEILLKVKNDIRVLLESTDKICTGSYFKEQIEKCSEIRYTRFYYSAIAKIVCMEMGWFWSRYLSSRNSFSKKLTLNSYVMEQFSNIEDSSFDDFSRYVKKVFEIDDGLLKDEFYRIRPILLKNSRAA